MVISGRETLDPNKIWLKANRSMGSRSAAIARISNNFKAFLSCRKTRNISCQVINRPSIAVAAAIRSKRRAAAVVRKLQIEPIRAISKIIFAIFRLPYIVVVVFTEVSWSECLAVNKMVLG